MFSITDILDRTRRQPFQPFRLVTTTGQTYEIRHPDQALATRSFVTVPVSPTAEGVPDRVANVAILHLVEIQDLALVAPPVADETGNGSV